MWNQALLYFSKGIKAVDNHPNSIRSNIKSTYYNEFSHVSYYQNDTNSALSYSKEGLKAFDADGDWTHLKYLLMVNQVNYLKNQSQIEEALNILGSMWQESHQIVNTEVLLNMYELQAELLNKTKRYQEATKFAMTGIELALIEKNDDRLFDLWINRIV
ncbi:hypothetical protein [Thermoflavimicrobium daqui]|uniref:MalT-like TPR region domain-containing protein n=1 Tax=Thermoflavimicrobium daqui TaxID=2137476 RepID=A0A364K2A7_9BACL|nr:hypothetical protein [Thermoflavimicrobium daqui]RAL22564.1 hypothetical protein DL897_14225 [Thermoflavimicrobium daqui]